jgi:hypothetical protein
MAGDGWDNFSQIERILAPWSGKYSDDFLRHPEQGHTNLRYLIPSQTGEPVGRLHVNLAPAVDMKTQTPIFVLTLTARGRPIGDGVEGALSFLDLGREWIVRGFASLTTPEMHRMWRRIDAR